MPLYLKKALLLYEVSCTRHKENCSCENICTSMALEGARFRLKSNPDDVIARILTLKMFNGNYKVEVLKEEAI